GKVPRDAYAGVAGDSRWRPVLEIPEVAAALKALETKIAEPPKPAPQPMASAGASASGSARAPLAPQKPSSMNPPAPPITFVTPPRVAQVSEAQMQTGEVAGGGTLILRNGPDATIPTPGGVSSSAPTVRASAVPTTPMGSSAPST